MRLLDASTRRVRRRVRGHRPGRRRAHDSILAGRPSRRLLLRLGRGPPCRAAVRSAPDRGHLHAPRRELHPGADPPCRALGVLRRGIPRARAVGPASDLGRDEHEPPRPARPGRFADPGAQCRCPRSREAAPDRRRGRGRRSGRLDRGARACRGVAQPCRRRGQHPRPRDGRSGLAVRNARDSIRHPLRRPPLRSVDRDRHANGTRPRRAAGRGHVHPQAIRREAGGRDGRRDRREDPRGRVHTRTSPASATGCRTSFAVSGFRCRN